LNFHCTAKTRPWDLPEHPAVLLKSAGPQNPEQIDLVKPIVAPPDNVKNLVTGWT